MSEFDDRYHIACNMLAEGAAKGRHPYHLMTVACVNSDHQPELRTVVMRRFEAEPRLIMFHTDIRSPKARWMQENPAVSLLFYDKESRIQLRFYANAKIHHKDVLCEKQWATTRQDSKVCYLAPVGSGEVVEAAGQCGMSGKIDREEDDQLAYENLAVVSCHYHLLDMVQLDYRGHERAMLRWDDSDVMQAQWVAV